MNDIDTHMHTHGLFLVGLSDKPDAVPLSDLPRQLADYARKFPNVLAPEPEVQIGLMVFDDDTKAWVPLTLEMLHARDNS